MSGPVDVHTLEEREGNRRAGVALERHREEASQIIHASRDAFALEHLTDDEFAEAMALAKKKQQRVKQVVMGLLEDGTHYGTAPGIPKPFAWQGAGDEIRRIYRWSARPTKPATISSSQEFVSATVTIGIFDSNGTLLLERSGVCNTKENRFKSKSSGWTYVDAREKEHDCLSMAEKRATLKATLAAAGATTYFQNPNGLDVGETDGEDDAPAWSDEQKKAFTTAARAAGMKSGAEIAEFVAKILGERAVLERDIPTLTMALEAYKAGRVTPLKKGDPFAEEKKPEPTDAHS